MSSPDYEDVTPGDGSTASVHMAMNICYEATKNLPRSVSKKCIVSTLVVIVVVIFSSLVLACTVLALEVSKLKCEMATFRRETLSNQLEQVQNFENSTEQINTIYEVLNSRVLVLENQFQLLSGGFEYPCGRYIFNLTSSCAALSPSSSSGYYWVRTSSDSIECVYCDMTRSCGNITGGWMRVGHLNMKNSSHQCPNGFVQRRDANIRTCVRNSSDSGGCSPIMVSTLNIEYTHVCGRVIAYQYGQTDAFHPTTIDYPYVEGVSLTHGSPRSRVHIWTFAAARHEIISELPPHYSCPCINDQVDREVALIPSSVGDDYFCDTGSQGGVELNVFYGNNPLWDGAGCGPQSKCCSFNNPPWFHKQLPQSTTDDIEMRVCRNEHSGNEDIALEMFDIYVI